MIKKVGKTVKKAIKWYFEKTAEGYACASINALSPYAVNHYKE